MITNFTTQYLPPLLLTIIIALAGLLLLYWLSQRGVATRVWDIVVRYRGPLGFLFSVILFVVAFSTFLVRQAATVQLRSEQIKAFDTRTNLITSGQIPGVSLIDENYPIQAPQDPQNERFDRNRITLSPDTKAASNVIAVRPGQSYRYSMDAITLVIDAPVPDAQVQVRLLWFDAALSLLSWTDRAPFPARGRTDPNDPAAFYSNTTNAPPEAVYAQIELRNADNEGLWIHIRHLQFSQEGIYIELHPNATSGSIAFSFDWESAMGGAVHSKGDEAHDVASAIERGLEHREGADWLNELFVSNHISATFYGTGYNLLDGNTERRTFNGDPTYKWAAPENGWDSEYWLTHPWFSDDPFGTYKSDPAWYFGDQTRALLAAGHEIAPHTFAHIYVRGSSPEELATDLDEWIKYAEIAGVPPPVTFAFPWRSSNSLTKEFYDALYSRGIRAITRIYPLDMKDLYTLGNAVVYTDIKQARLYPDMPVMPDFLLGSPSASAGEEAGGAPITREQGLEVIKETIARRGTTSFWQHPEQLADGPAFSDVRAAWTDVVAEAVQERDHGKLWIATVAEITAYQRDVMSVTATLQPPGLFGGKWRIEVRNDSGKELHGVTLTLPGEASAATGQSGTLQSVSHPEPAITRLSAPGEFVEPTRQLVLASLAPGTTSIEVEWTKGQEPLQ